jgi:hypothetical protein
VYVFVRQDLGLAHQLVQSNHATFHLARLTNPDPEIPNLIVIGVPNEATLGRVRAKLEIAQLPHYVWTEPDEDMGVTAIATGPLDEQERVVLKNYRLWSHSRGAEQSACRVTADPGAKSALSSNGSSGGF